MTRRLHKAPGSEDPPEAPGCFSDEYILGAARALGALAEAVPRLIEATPACIFNGRVPDRGHFRPVEEKEIFSWFARFLTIRSELWDLLRELSEPVEAQVSRIISTFEWRCFVLGYSAACLIVRLDRHLIEDAATGSPAQRKLNEGSSGHRIPRKQFTRIFESLTDPSHAKAMREAMLFSRRHRALIEGMKEDEFVGRFVNSLSEFEASLDPSRRRYLGRLLSFLSHSFRRRGASGLQQTLFAILENSGRLISDIHAPWMETGIPPEARREILELLMPGDVLITRHDYALTNLFLPGYWPHAALYVGSCEDRERLDIEVDSERRRRWSGNRRVLEALKDGVLFRDPEQTLAVDAVAIIRPKLEEEEIALALSRVLEHEGKAYNFDFDFFRSDRLVCTEVVYRAFDGVSGIEIPLRERSGRPTLSAEDLLDLALESRGFEPVAIAGATNCPDRVATGLKARELIADSY